MNNAWLLIGACAVVTFAIKAAGPVALGGRQLPPWLDAVVPLLAPALLAALVATHIFADDNHLAVGANTVGVAAAGVVMWRTQSIVFCVLTAAVVTALLRAV
jgi:branched-subunit amino acid transport protein